MTATTKTAQAMPKQKTLHTALCSALFAATLLPAAVMAQTPAADPAKQTAAAAKAAADKAAAEKAAAETPIETIVVTSRKRSEELQTVPVAVSAFTGDSLKRANIESAPDIQFSVPSAILVGGDTFTIRGIGNGSLGGDAGVGVFLNGASFGPAGQDLFYDIERIEVLRGPQGTLFGRNTTGGAVNVFTKRATNKFGGEFMLETGNFNEKRIGGVINFAITPNLQQRFAGYKYERDGFTKNIFNGNKIDGRNQGSFRSSTRLLIGDDSELNIIAGIYDENSTRTRETKRLCKAHPTLGCSPTELGFDSPSYSGTIFNAIQGASGIPPGTNLYAGAVNPANVREVSADTDPRFTLEQRYVTLDFTHETDDHTYTYVGGYSWGTTEQTTDWDNASLPFRFSTPRTYNRSLDNPVTTNQVLTSDNFFTTGRSTSHELRMNTKYKGMFNFTLGAFYLESVNKGGFLTFHPLIEGLQRLRGRPADEHYINTRFGGTLETTALFGEANFKLSDKLRAAVGLRHTRDDRTSTSRSAVLSTSPPPTALGTLSASKSTGRVTVDYAMTPNNFLYGTIATGYKAGGLNIAGSNAPAFKPELVTSYELGLKNTLADGTLQANFTVYQNDYKDMQLGQRINGATLNSNTDAKTKGVEMEFVWAPSKQLLLDANVSFLNTRIGSFLTVDAASWPAPLLNPAVVQVPVSLSGNHLPYSPEKKYKLGAQWTSNNFLNSGWQLVSRIDHVWQDTYFAREFNTPTDKISAWSVTNLQFRMFKTGGNLQFKAYVKNLGDKDHVTRIVIEDALIGSYRNARYLDPRTVGVALEYKF
jgi:iron complex outermembrane recepter protein